MNYMIGFYFQPPYSMLIGWENVPSNDEQEYHLHLLLFSIMIRITNNEQAI